MNQLNEDLKAIETSVSNMAEAYETKIKTLEQQIEDLKTGIEFIKYIQNLPEFVAAAKKEAKTIDEYFMDVVALVKNPNKPVISIPSDLYMRIKRLAEMRCVSTFELMQMEDMREKIEMALDNLVY